jgi:hypothetical protein
MSRIVLSSPKSKSRFGELDRHVYAAVLRFAYFSPPPRNVMSMTSLELRRSKHYRLLLEHYLQTERIERYSSHSRLLRIWS